MLTNKSFFTVPKSSVINIRLFVALLITTVIHLLLIVELKIDSPIKKTHAPVILITLIKSPHKIRPKPPVKINKIVPKLDKPVAKVESNDWATHPPALKPLLQPPRPTEQATQLTSSTASVHPSVVEPVIVETAQPKAPLAPTEPATVEPVKQDVMLNAAPTHIVVPEAVPAPVVPESIPLPVVPKVEVTPVAPLTPAVTAPAAVTPVENKPLEPEKVSVPVVEIPADVVTKPANFPPPVSKVGSKKSAKKARKKSPKQSTSLASSETDTAQPTLSLDGLAAQIAQVGEKFANQPPPTMGETRIKKLNEIRQHSVSARQYILDWQHKVEQIGNTNYPAAAREKDFSARLMMEVGINTDGTIHSMTIKKSSGIAALDEAAKNIVQMGAPYAALPTNLAQELDVLIIQRTWSFSDESGMTTQ